MRILFLDWACFGKDDTIETLKRLGNEVFIFSHPEYNAEIRESFVSEFKTFYEKNKIELCFSYNFYPPLAEGCKEVDIPYVSFVYDSPYTLIYSYTLMYLTNYVFLFDSSWVEELRAGGLSNVYYMVLPGNTKRIGRMLQKPYDKNRMKADVSFVGTLYNEQHNLYERLVEKAPKYLKGYLDGIVAAQQKVYGYSFVEELLTEDILKQMRQVLDARPGKTSAEPPKYRYANYFIKRKITQQERIKLLTMLGESFGDDHILKLFTVDEKYRIRGVKNMGVARYENEMPYVFHDSRINLNISLRSINTGIPLRCIDIMSNGGFLLSNYQSDLLIDFIPGEDFDYFESPEDMLSKIEYYLSHEEERRQIAINGQKKVEEYFSFDKVFGRIFDIVFPKQD